MKICGSLFASVLVFLLGANLSGFGISYDDINPLWGPDSETIAFERIYKSRPVEYQIYILEPFNQRNITRIVPKERDDSSHNSFFRWIDIKNKGNSKIYEYVYVKNPKLYIGQFSNSYRSNSISEDVFVSTDTSENGYPDYSSQNKRIAFVSGVTGVTDIYVKKYEGISSPDKGPGERLFTNDLQDTMPRWSPDGNDLAYSSQVAGNMEIFVLRNALSENRKFTRLTSSEFDKTVPTWSPDGKMIAFYSLRVKNADEKVFDLCVVDAENGREIARVEFVHRQEHRGPVWARMPDALGIIKNWVFYISGDYSMINALEIEESRKWKIVNMKGLEGYAYGNITDLDCIYTEGDSILKEGVRMAYSALSENYQKRIYFAICDIMDEGFFIKTEIKSPK